jgi:UDP-glucose 4-epimerase
MFVPENFLSYGFRLLKGGVDDRDVAQAFIHGLQNDDISFDAFNIMAEVPFSPVEFKRWREEPGELIDEHFPGFRVLMERSGTNVEELLQMWGHTYWSIDKAKALLGYQPQYNFREFYAALKDSNEMHYPYANLPWWGV